MERLVRLWALGLALVCVTALPVVGQECVTLKTPELVDIIEGDRQVELWWRDVYPESLTCVHQPKLGTAQSPWRGNAGMTSGGFYVGGCDFDYRFNVVISDSARFQWTEVNWVTGSQQVQQVHLPSLLRPRGVHGPVDAQCGRAASLGRNSMGLVLAVQIVGSKPRPRQQLCASRLPTT